MSTDFTKSITRGFASARELEVAVCLRPGTELAFDQDEYDRFFSLFGKARINHKVARFRQVDIDNPHTHHELEVPFGGGRTSEASRVGIDTARCRFKLRFRSRRAGGLEVDYGRSLNTTAAFGSAGSGRRQLK